MAADVVARCFCLLLCTRALSYWRAGVLQREHIYINNNENSSLKQPPPPTSRGRSSLEAKICCTPVQNATGWRNTTREGPALSHTSNFKKSLFTRREGHTHTRNMHPCIVPTTPRGVVLWVRFGWSGGITGRFKPSQLAVCKVAL